MRILAAAVAALAAMASAALAQDYPWKPDKPVTLIVPWAAGGSTDQMARIVASELEAELKQKFIVVNQPGASGSVGTKNALEAPKDGYTWAAGAATDIGTYRVLGLLDTGTKYWNMYFAIANLTAISANPGAPFKEVRTRPIHGLYSPRFAGGTTRPEQPSDDFPTDRAAASSPDDAFLRMGCPRPLLP